MHKMTTNSNLKYDQRNKDIKCEAPLGLSGCTVNNHQLRQTLFMTILKTLLSLAFLTPVISHAKLFRNSYVSFELPVKWDCSLVDTEWVCRNTDIGQQRDKEAIIILTAKEVGPADSFQAYEAHLKAQKILPSSAGQAVRSQILNVTQRQINGHPWVDGMHLNSEVRDYYTRYLATVKDRIAVLVTFSAHKLHYSKYTSDFFRAIESLRVLSTRGLMNSQTLGSVRPGSETLGANIQTALPADFGEDLPEEGSGGSGSGSTQMILAVAVLLGAIGAYLLLKKNKKESYR